MADPNFSDSQKLLDAVKVLEGLEKAGTIRPAEQAALDKFRAKQAPAQEVQADTIARYRGFTSGLTQNLKDEGAGVLAAILKLTEGPASFGETYTATRDNVRQKDLAAQVLAPDAYSSGQMAGSLTSAVIPAGGVMKATAGMPTWAKAAYGGVTGGILGGLPGFGEGEGMSDRLSRAAMPAAVGAGLGILAPVLGGIGGTVVRGVRTRSGNVPGYGAKSSQIMARAMGKSEAAGTDIQQYLSTLGPDGMIADIPATHARWRRAWLRCRVKVGRR
jgi:hypothetical protein